MYDVESEEHQLNSKWKINLWAIMWSSFDHMIFSPYCECPFFTHLTVIEYRFVCFFFLSPQRLTYSPDTPVGDAAKLYWHFYRADQSGAAGVIITLFLYAVLFLLSITILSIYLLRWDNQEDAGWGTLNWQLSFVLNGCVYYGPRKQTVHMRNI